MSIAIFTVFSVFCEKACSLLRVLTEHYSVYSHAICSAGLLSLQLLGNQNVRLFSLCLTFFCFDFCSLRKRTPQDRSSRLNVSCQCVSLLNGWLIDLLRLVLRTWQLEKGKFSQASAFELVCLLISCSSSVQMSSFRLLHLCKLSSRSVLLRSPLNSQPVHLSSVSRLLLPLLVARSDKVRFAHQNFPPSDPKYGGDADLYLAPGFTKRPPGPKTVEDFANPEGEDKNWVSYGFDYFDKDSDRVLTHIYFFSIVTVFLCGICFCLYYYPDTYYQQNWAVREGFLELERRRKNGLPLVDKNYVDASKIELPSDEELKGTEIYYWINWNWQPLFVFFSLFHIHKQSIVVFHDDCLFSCIILMEKILLRLSCVYEWSCK